MNKIILLLFTLMLVTVSHAEVPKTLKFATEATYPPFEYVNESGQIQGFDIDIANALCKKMNVTCTFSNQSFNSLIPSLQIGKFDALVSALGVTAEREKEIAFTQSYYQPSGSFVTLSSKQMTLATLEGKTVGVQQSSTFEYYLKNKYGNKIKLKTYASIQEAFLDLISGRVEAVLADTPIAKAWLKLESNHSYSIVEKPIVDPTYFGTGYAIAVRQDNTELLTALNTALAAIKADGTYQKILSHYFGG